jgi:hypothetical protein
MSQQQQSNAPTRNLDPPVVNKLPNEASISFEVSSSSIELMTKLKQIFYLPIITPHQLP